MSVVARGDNASDVHNGDLTATGADLSGKNVTLQSGWDTTHSSSKGSSFGGAIGVEAGVTDGLSVVGNGSGSHQHANGDSSSAVNTTVSATDKVTITAPGKTTINGAIVSGNQVSVNTGNLDIISPQDTSHYNSSSSQVGGGLKVGVPGAGTGWGANGNYADQNIKDDYQSTGKQQSGLYAGDGGLQVQVDGTTYLKGGVMSSTGGNSYLDTGKLIAESQENHSKIDATSTGGGLNVGTDALGGSLGPLGMIAGNMASNSGLMTGGNRKQDDNSTTQSAISSEVKVKAGSTQGNYTTDVASADGHMGNNFDADKFTNYLQNSQLGMQLVGEVMGQFSDALNDNGVPGFDETNVTNDWGRIILEAAGSAAVAGVTGGNVGAATGSSVAGNAILATTGQYIADNAVALAGNDQKLAELFTNIGANLVANAAGAAAGGAIDGSSGAFNGADIASTLQQYNWTFGGTASILVNNSHNTALEAAGKIPSEAGKGALQGAVVGAVAGEGVGAIPGAVAGAIKGTVSAIVSTIFGAIVDAVNQDNANEQAAANATQKKDETSVSGGSSGGNVTPPDDNDGEEKTQKTENLTKDENGNPIGTNSKYAGKDSIRTLPKQAEQKTVDQWLQGAKKIDTPENYGLSKDGGRGQYYERADGVEFGIRQSNKNGTTIEIKNNNGQNIDPNFKIHFK